MLSCKRCFFDSTIDGKDCFWESGKMVKSKMATATLFLLGGRLGKSRVCEMGHEVLCQNYAKRWKCELGHGERLN